MRARILLSGWLPERALTRLHRVGIALYNIKKVGKEETTFEVDERDAEKVLALYPKTEGYATYTAKRLPSRGVRRAFETLKARVGIVVGCIVFLGVCALADGRVLSVKIDGETPYETEIASILKESGVEKFGKYDATNADLISSRILALEGVGFASVKKVGSTLVVEVRGASFVSPSVLESSLVSPVEGVVTDVVLLRGVSCAQTGQTVAKGETLVTGETQGGVELMPVACVRLACKFEEKVRAESEKEAYAKAYLAIGLDEKQIKLKEKSAEQTEDGFLVKIGYELALTVNYGG